MRTEPAFLLVALAALSCTNVPAREPSTRVAATPGAAAPSAPKPPANPATSTRDPRAATVERIVRAALAEGRAYERLVELCELAPKRLSGSAGEQAAVLWARETLSRDGHENVRLEPVTVPHWVRGARAELSVVSPAEERSLPLPILALGGSVSTRGERSEKVTGELVVVTSFEELRALGREAVGGRIVLFNRPMDASNPDPFAAYGGAVDQRARGAIEAARLGAVAAIVRSVSTRIDDVPHTGAMRYDEGVPRIPAAAVSTAGADRLAAAARASGKLELELVLDCETLPDADSANVVAELVGTTRADEIVLVGSHLDAWDVGHGAHDDGAGTVHVIEALRLLRTLGLTPKRTIRAVLFANEENGLRGGRTYRETHLAELDRHVFAIESDRGGFVPRGFATDAGPAAFATLAAICASFEGVGGARLLAGGGGADISPLAKDGIVLAELLPDPQRYFDVHHCASDVIEAVHPRELELGAAYLAALLWCVAELDEPLPRNPAR